MMTRSTNSGESPRTPSGSPRSVAFLAASMRRAVVVGVVWVVSCGIANGWPVVTALGQMAVPSIWVAAFVAYRAASESRRAALLGGITLLAADVAYFAVRFIARGYAGLPLVGGIRFFALWATVGLVIGPIAGAVGWWLTIEPRSRRL